MKTPGQIAYEEDVRLTPTYLDGRPRRAWSQLGEAERWSWERNPTPRPRPASPALLMQWTGKGEPT